MATSDQAKKSVIAEMASGADRLVALVRSLNPADGGLPVPGLDWTVAETAAHVVTVAGRLLGDRRRSRAAGETDLLNAQCLAEFDERDLAALASRIEADMRIVVERVYPKVDFDRTYPFHSG